MYAVQYNYKILGAWTRLPPKNEKSKHFKPKFTSFKKSGNWNKVDISIKMEIKTVCKMTKEGNNATKGNT